MMVLLVNDHKEMDVFVGLTSPSNPQYSGVHFGINLGRGGGGKTELSLS